MRTFVYQGVNEDGHAVTGLVTAETRNEALSQLRGFRLHIRTLSEQSKIGAFFSSLKRVKRSALAIYTRELAAMFKSGLPLLRCLEVLANRGEDKLLEEVTVHVREKIKAGGSFFHAISAHPKVFDPVYLTLVQSGEISGHLGETLDRIAGFLERDVKLRQQAKAVMTYPLIVFTFCVLIAGGLVIFIFPQFIDMFQGFDVALPWPTRFLIAVVSAFKNPVSFFTILAVLIVGFNILLRYIKTPVGRQHFDRLMLTFPVIGNINKKIAIARFCRTFSTLFASGVPILQALDVVSRVSGNALINESVERVREAVKYGSSVAVPMAETGLFPLMVTSMVQVGEQSGHLQALLTKIADYYEMEVEVALASLSKLIEPLLIGAMGGIVGFVLIAIFMPIYQLINSFSK